MWEQPFSCPDFQKKKQVRAPGPKRSWKQEMMGVDQYNAVTGILESLRAPIIMDAEIGHMDPMLPVIMGAGAKVRIIGNDLKLRYC